MKVMERVPKEFLASYLRLQSCRLGENMGSFRADNHVDCGDLDSQLKDLEELRLRRYYERLS